jgi:SAM-dependent methyltransferase
MSVRASTRKFLKDLKSRIARLWLALPKQVECNLCGWQGRRFLGDSWHEGVNCPRCGAGVRQRLFAAALHGTGPFAATALLEGKRILHFAPEARLGAVLRQGAARYATADYLREDCDFPVNMSDMPSIPDGSFDVVVAFDVLEHVPDYRSALREVRRVLAPSGWAIFTVPQQDHLARTYEDAAIVSPKERERHFGQWDHLRVFGDDFPGLLEDAGLRPAIVDESSFGAEQVRRHVLFPPVLSPRPLATNYRKVYFSRKGPES